LIGGGLNMTRFGKATAFLMIICLSFYALLLFGVLPKEQIKEFASPVIEKLIQLGSWLKVKIISLWEIVIQKFFSRSKGLEYGQLLTWETPHASGVD
jgi:hypothetical protein